MFFFNFLHRYSLITVILYCISLQIVSQIRVWVMKNKFSKDLIAPCGMDCNVCSGFLAMRHDIKNKGIPMTYCQGCRPRDKKCAFLKKRCERLLKHSVTFCSECPEFPCENITHIDTRYQKFFRMSLLENLASIKTNGMEQFLRAEEEKWRCPNCGGTISCHNGLCFVCDTALLKKKKQLYRWDDE